LTDLSRAAGATLPGPADTATQPFGPVVDAIASDLAAEMAAGSFPEGVTLALTTHRSGRLDVVRIVVRGLGNESLFDSDGSLWPEVIDLQTSVAHIAFAYTGATTCQLEVVLETDYERQLRRRYGVLLAVLQLLSSRRVSQRRLITGGTPATEDAA
jgi:hypothetical protein